MRIFVGTLKTIENEFQECVASIDRQTYQDFEHFVFEDLPNKEAHDTLYRSFMERSDEFDLMVKVDADMVIENENLFAGIVERFERHPQLKDLEIAVHDFFSDRLIWGLHAYRNTMTWEENDENLFVDSASLESQERIHDDDNLAPAAVHCKNPSPFQAFHYGVHKAVKVIQPGRWKKEEGRSQFHWTNIQETKDHFHRTGDRRLGFAVLGAEFGFAKEVKPKHISYSNPYLRNCFDQFSELDTQEIQEEIDNLAQYTIFPSPLRHSTLMYFNKAREIYDMIKYSLY